MNTYKITSEQGKVTTIISDENDAAAYIRFLIAEGVSYSVEEVASDYRNVTAGQDEYYRENGNIVGEYDAEGNVFRY